MGFRIISRIFYIQVSFKIVSISADIRGLDSESRYTVQHNLKSLIGIDYFFRYFSHTRKSSPSKQCEKKTFNFPAENGGEVDSLEIKRVHIQPYI
jgi:hypothetical protein